MLPPIDDADISRYKLHHKTAVSYTTVGCIYIHFEVCAVQLSLNTSVAADRKCVIPGDKC